MSEIVPPIDIRPEHWRIVRDILQRHLPGVEVWAFGSRAKGTARKYSDLDLVVLTDRPLPLDLGARLREAFSESDLPYRVDVIDWASTDEAFRRIIKRERVVVQQQGGGRSFEPKTALG
jgi:type I restriction enzyme S subunit